MTLESVVQGRVHAKHGTTAILAPIATFAEERGYHRSTISMIFAGRMSVSLVLCVQCFAMRQLLLAARFELYMHCLPSAVIKAAA
jgi:ornithine carbamoyltransferase